MRNLIKRLQKGQEGFTLIELLVVVTIIALLAAFAVPKLFEAINKSRKAPGQADMQTISSALERFYLDNPNSAYPLAATVTDDLAGGYLKATTSYVNGFDRGYIYVTDAAGSFYVLIDAMNTAPATNLTLTCNAVNVTVNTGAAGMNAITTAAIDATDVAAGCSITAGMPAGQTPTVITN